MDKISGCNMENENCSINRCEITLTKEQFCNQKGPGTPAQKQILKRQSGFFYI